MYSFFDFRRKMFVLKNAEELNKLFVRNKEMNMLLNTEDRNILNNLLNEVSKAGYSHLLQTFLALQVYNIYF